jgi:hypothetical protein
MHPKIMAGIIALRETTEVSINKAHGTPHERIIEHPAKTNKHHDEYRFCHPHNSRTRISKATFAELKKTLNEWTPDSVPEKAQSREVIMTPDTRESILRKCLIRGEETLDDMHLIVAFQHGLFKDKRWSPCLKVVIYDKKKCVFLLRTAGEKYGARRCGYTKEIDVHSYDDEWYVDRSTLLAHKKFWFRLRDIVNAM